MYRLRVETNFNAAHKLEGYTGKCAKLHGHTWTVEVFVTGEQLDSIGMLMDFSVLKAKVDEIVEKLDHNYINQIEAIGNPTVENIAKYICQSLTALLKNARLEKIRVWESPESWSEYIPKKTTESDSKSTR